MEKVPCIPCDWSNMSQVVREVSCWRFLTGRWHFTVGWARWSWHWWRRDINWEQSMLYHTGDSWHTQNIQNNKLIGENENFAFYFTEKTKQTFWPTQYYNMEYTLNIYIHSYTYLRNHLTCLKRKNFFSLNFTFFQCKYLTRRRLYCQNIRLWACAGFWEVFTDCDDKQNCGNNGLYGPWSFARRNHTQVWHLQLWCCKFPIYNW